MQKHIKISLAAIILLILISLLTGYYGSTDVQEYAGSAKFFAGKYNSDIRASHSMLYGFVHAPLVFLFNSFIGLKITSLIFLVLIIISVYYISGWNKKTLYLILASPLIWYMGPWINPIQLASLLFLWAFFFMIKFNKTERIRYLAYSGLLAGLSAAFWNTAIYVAIIFAVCFFYKKNVNSLFIFALSMIVGLLPVFLLEQSLFGVFFFSFAKTTASNLLAGSFGGIYQGVTPRTFSILFFITFLLITPFFSYILFQKENFAKNKRQAVFVLLTFLFFLLNPQIRYLLFLYPLLVLYIGRYATQKQFKIQMIIFLIISLIVITPYVIQIKSSTDSPEFRTFVSNFGAWKITSPPEGLLITQDLKELTSEHPGEIFVVGPEPDDYTKLAFNYWGKDVGEFVSVQDYQLALKNETVIFKKRFESSSKIQNRRQIWIEGGISRNPDDKTDHGSINYAISVDKNLNLPNFRLVKELRVLSLFEKI